MSVFRLQNKNKDSYHIKNITFIHHSLPIVVPPQLTKGLSATAVQAIKWYVNISIRHHVHILMHIDTMSPVLLQFHRSLFVTWILYHGRNFVYYIYIPKQKKPRSCAASYNSMNYQLPSLWMPQGIGYADHEGKPIINTIYCFCFCPEPHNDVVNYSHMITFDECQNISPFLLNLLFHTYQAF